ncbi:uncharacterized protein PHACADRAFT_209222, partial [Phanerochaete carnosa HHB-10118-sp]
MGDTSPPQSSSTMLPSPPSEMEAKYYYYGLHSKPVLVARSSTTPWEAPTGPEADWPCKELRVFGNHPLKEVWEGGLGLKFCGLLGSMKVQWTSIDLLRIGEAEEYLTPPARVVWIGVRPASLSGHDGVDVVTKCHNLLVEHDIVDVDVEIRESLVWPDYGELREPEGPRRAPREPHKIKQKRNQGWRRQREA